MPLNFELHFVRNASLPPLAWCAKLERGSPQIIVELGADVETGRDYFVEGAWNRPFDDPSFADAEMMLGSAGRLHDGEMIFTPTTHTMERLHSLPLDDALYVSNSLAHLLAATGSRLDIRYDGYEPDFMSFLRGLRKATKVIPIGDGRHVSLHYHESFAVDRNLALRFITPPEAPPFPSYQSYIDYLHRLVESLHANASSPARRLAYQPLTTISSGYDSPAGAVLARHIGCREAVTFAEARTKYALAMNDTTDSGEEIGRRLGFEVETFARDGYLKSRDFPEAIFLATGNGGDDTVMAGLSGRLRHQMLFTGFTGDSLWATRSHDPILSREYRMRFPSGSCLQEFRLRESFVHLCVPLLTFTRHDDLERISNSEEMKPWRIGGNYDRPIPRRMTEEAGVPREAFGMEKRAITQPFWLQRANDDSMSPASLEDFNAFVTRTAARLPLGMLQVKAEGLTRRLRHVVRKRLPGWESDPYSSDAYLEALANPEPLRFHWAMDKLMPAYQGSRLGESRLLKEQAT
jgi:hypothetical protein